MSGFAMILRVAKEADRSGRLYDTMPNGCSLRMKSPAIRITCCACSPLHMKSILATVAVVRQHKCIVAVVELSALYAAVENDSSAA